MSDRSAITVISLGTRFFTKPAMTERTSSCLVLYLHSSSATSQLFRMWQSVCLSPHSLHATEICSLYLHKALWGRELLAAFKANFNCADGRDCAISAHIVPAVGSVIRRSLPWTSREQLCCSISSCNSFSMLSLAFLETALANTPGSEAWAFWVAVKGWNLACCWAFSFSSLWHTTWLTVLSWDAIKRLALPTWSFWYRKDGRDRLKPPLDWRRNSLAELADLVSPDHDQRLRYRVAMGSGVFSSHETGYSDIVRSQESLGQMPRQYSLNFCCLVTGILLTLDRRDVRLLVIVSRASAWFWGTRIVPPRNLTV